MGTELSAQVLRQAHVLYSQAKARGPVPLPQSSWRAAINVTTEASLAAQQGPVRPR